MSFSFGLVAIEGMIMRMVVTGDANPLPEMFSHPEHYFSIMTVHPIVGILVQPISWFCCLYVLSPVFKPKRPLYRY